MTLRACGHCERDLPADSHHLLRYCPDRDCAVQAKKKAKKAARKSKAPAPGTVRKIGRRHLVFLPGHALASASGWTSAKRVSMYERLGGADPGCATCHRRLDWSAPGPAEGRVCVIAPPKSDDLVVLCSACLRAVGVAGGALGVPLHPLSWAEACDSYNPPVEDGGGYKGAGAAAHGEEGSPRLALVLDEIFHLWDGTEEHASHITAAGTLLTLRARRRERAAV